MLKFIYLSVILVLLSNSAIAHEMTPSYLELKPSFIDNVYSTELTLFNRREDVSFYQVEVFSDNWSPIPYATSVPIINIEYLQIVKFLVFVREIDIDKVVYICTISKVTKQSKQSSLVSSRICSKVKRDKS